MDKKPIKKKGFHFKADKTFIADFETTTNNCNWYKRQSLNPDAEQVRLTYWYMKSWDGLQEYEGTNIDTFMKTIMSFKGRHIQIYFHNLTFDGDFIYNWLAKNKPDKFMGIVKEDDFYKIQGYELEETANCRYWSIKQGYYSIFQSNGKIMNISLGNHDGKNKQIIDINCSLRLLNSSVAGLAKSYNMNKMTKEDKELGHAFYDVEPNDNLETFKRLNKNYVEYCKRDVEIVRLSLIDFKKTIDELPFVKNKNQENDRANGVNIAEFITIASLGRNLLENVFVKGFQYGYKIYKQNGKWELSTDENGKPYINKTQQKKYNQKNKQVVVDEYGVDDEYSYGNMVKIDMKTHNIFDENHYWFDEEGNINEDVFDRFYRGGLTQFNPEYYNWKDIGRSCKLDISSAYPYHMTKPLPFGKWIYEKDFWKNHYQEGWTEGEDYIEFVKVWVKECIPKEANKHCCVIPNWTNAEVAGWFNKYYRKNPEKQYDFVITTTRREWDELQHWADFIIDEEPDINGKPIKKIEKFYMYAAPFLKQIANILYDLKDYYAKTGETGKKQGTKIFLNSLYGSLALGTEYDNLYYVDKSLLNDFEKDEEITLFNTQFENEKDYKFLGLSKSRDYYNQAAIRLKYEKQKKFGFNKAAGAVITSYERVYLMETIRKIGAEYFGYCDTDSILFVNLTKEKLKELVDLSNEKTGLGKWEFEDTYIIEYRGAGAKKYKTKSIPCLIDNEGNDKFYNYDEKGNKIWFENAEQAIEYAERTGKYHVNTKIAGITQENGNDTILDIDAEQLKDENIFNETIINIWEKQDKTFKENNYLNSDTIKEWYKNYIERGEIPIIAGNKTSIRVNGGRLLITDNKILQMNKLFT